MESRQRRKTGCLLVAFALLMVAILMVGIFPQPASGQSGGSPTAGLAVSPPIFETDTTPGQTITQKFSINNLSDSPRTVSVEVQNFRAKDEEGQADLTDETSPFSITSWTTVSPQTATIPPRGTGEFTATIKVPATPGPGGHFGALVFNPKADSSQAQVQVISAVSSLVLLRTPGTATEKLSISQFSTISNKTAASKTTEDAQTFFQKGPVKFVLRLKNEGNVQVKPEVNIEIRNMFGSKIATIPVESQRILPDSTRRIEATWNHSQLLGSYTAKATVKYGTTSETITTSATFWGAPIVQIVIVLLVLLAVFLLVWLPRKRIRKALKALASSDS